MSNQSGSLGSKPFHIKYNNTNMLEKAFRNEELGIEITSFIDKKLRIWFKAKEVAQILGYKKTENAIKRHVSENHKRKILLSCPPETGGQVIKDKKSCPVVSTGQVQGRWIIFVDEPGFYELVFRSRLPSARIFREWVFTKVLPSIRKYGYYRMIDNKIKKRVIFDGVKYYKHPVFYRYAASKNGDILSLKSEKILKMKKIRGGYLSFVICDKKLEKPKDYLQHRFVYEVFKGEIPRCKQVDHINEVKADNRIKNLQLLTPQKNSEKSNSKPIISTNLETGKERRFISIKKASDELNIHAGNISSICCKRKSCKTAESKKDGKKYTFKFLD